MDKLVAVVLAGASQDSQGEVPYMGAQIGQVTCGW